MPIDATTQRQGLRRSCVACGVSALLYATWACSTSSSGPSDASADAPEDSTTLSDARATDGATDSGASDSPYPAFRGLVKFAGDARAGTDDPYVVAGTLLYYWSDLEPVQGAPDFSSVKADLAAWAAAGKRAILRVTSAGNDYGTLQRTPQWVFNAGAKKMVSPTTNVVYPVYWDPIYLAALKNFVKEFASAFDGDARVLYVNTAVGNDGETIPYKVAADPTWSSAWAAAGYTDQLYLSTIGQILDAYQSVFKTTPLALQPDETFLHVAAPDGGTLSEGAVLTLATSKGVWLQNDSLQAGMTLGPVWTTTALTTEQVSPAASRDASLAADLQTGLQLGSKYVLVFESDLEADLRDHDGATLAQFAAYAH